MGSSSSVSSAPGLSFASGPLWTTCKVFFSPRRGLLTSCCALVAAACLARCSSRTFARAAWIHPMQHPTNRKTPVFRPGLSGAGNQSTNLRNSAANEGNRPPCAGVLITAWRRLGNRRRRTDCGAHTRMLPGWPAATAVPPPTAHAPPSRTSGRRSCRGC